MRGAEFSGGRGEGSFGGGRSFGAADAASSGRKSESAAPLTERERECLLWAAWGKTAWETATILAISESAVKKHLGSAAIKLDARTGTQAVVTAVLRGLIHP